MKDKTIIKNALKHPELHSSAELLYFKLMKKANKAFKKVRQEADKS